MQKDVLHTIQENMADFSKGQKRIAAYILSDYDKAAFMTASKLGKLVDVSESTVVRFASTLGYDGYPAMQKALQEMVRSKLTSIQRIQTSNDRLFSSDVVASVLQMDMEKIRMAIDEVDRSAFTSVVDKLMGARHIYILGVRSSSFLAGYLHFYLHLIFENVTLVTSNSAGDILESTLRIGPGDLLVGISFPRYSKATVKGVQFARDRGADVVAITDSAMSPLSPMASAVLMAHSDMISFVDSLVAPFSLLNAIIVAAGHRKDADISQIFNRLEGIWDVVVVGGGPAGMMAAITAAECGAAVCLLEPNERLGKKLNITGKGRCNLTNSCDAEQFLQSVPRNGKFLYSAYYQFDSSAVMAFFTELGVPLKTERGNRVFPVSDRAFDVSGALEKRLRRLDVRLVRDRAETLVLQDGRLAGVKGSQAEYAAGQVVIATGGVS